MSFDPSDKPAPSSEPTASSTALPPSTAVPPSTALPPPPPVARQLVRDPYAKLGGVASGLSHHYGIDVSLIRLAFVVFTLLTGFGLLFYLLAWLIIPRAKYWPPVGSSKPTRSLTTREIAVGLLLIGVTVGIFVNGGTFSEVLVPLVLVGGGVWLLIQPNVEAKGGAVTAANQMATPTANQMAAPSIPPQPVDTVQPAAPQMPQGTPVTPRSRRRRGLIFGVVTAFVILPIVAVAGIVAAIFASDFSANPGFTVTYQPATVEAIPTDIDHDRGDVTLDLSLLSSADFEEPVSIDVNVDFGEVEIIVPDDLSADVQAETGLGDIQVFDRSADGFDNYVTYADSDADVRLDVSVGFGEVSVMRP